MKTLHPAALDTPSFNLTKETKNGRGDGAGFGFRYGAGMGTGTLADNSLDGDGGGKPLSRGNTVNGWGPEK
jgi:hypothetical protein